MMTHILKDYDSFSRACQIYRQYRAEKKSPGLSKLYVETTAESNLYQKRDGSWRLRFDEEGFKNLPESRGFSAHACRHLVATEYIKNYPQRLGRRRSGITHHGGDGAETLCVGEYKRSD